MNEKRKCISEIISELKIEDIKQDDLAVECIEDILQNQYTPRYISSHEDDYAGIYQESKYYNPFIHKYNIV